MKLDLTKHISDGPGRKSSPDDYRIKRAEQQYTVIPEIKVFKSNQGEFEVIQAEPIELKVTNSGNNKIHIAGEVRLTLGIPCDRCLSDVSCPVEFELDQDINFGDSDDTEDMEDRSFVDGHIIDIDEMLYPEIFMNLPSKVLCKDDCKGICRECGKNLNEGECGCDTFVADPRMAVINDVFKNFRNN